MNDLTPVQQKALTFCNKKAKIYSKAVLPNLHDKLVQKGLSKNDILKVFKYFRNAPLISHFNAKKTLQYLENDGIFKNLFEVGTGGGCTNISTRTKWENVLFNHIYTDASAQEKVKYGALNITSDPKGIPQSKQYGTSYLIFKKHVKKRSSIVFGDSCNQDYHLSTFRHFSNIIYYLKNTLLDEIIDISLNKKSFSTINYKPYLEVQMHGNITLESDVDMICIDSNLQDNDEINELLLSIKEKYGVDHTFI